MSSTLPRRVRSLFVAGTCWGGLVAAIGWFVGLTTADNAFSAALVGWFAGGLIGVIWVVLRVLRTPHAAFGYLAGLAVVALATNPLADAMTISPGSAGIVLTISPLYLLAPLFLAAVGLAASQPDVLAGFGLRSNEETGRRRITWTFLAWLSLPALCVLAGLWIAVHRPTDFQGKAYGQGSRTCRRAADCHLRTNCSDCGRCYSVAPVRGFECAAVCQVAHGTTCECADGLCVAVPPP